MSCLCVFRTSGSLFQDKKSDLKVDEEKENITYVLDGYKNPPLPLKDIINSHTMNCHRKWLSRKLD